MKGGENMSVTKTANAHSYFYLQKAKELFLCDQKSFKCNYASWDRLPKTKKDEYEYIARKMF